MFSPILYWPITFLIMAFEEKVFSFGNLINSIKKAAFSFLVLPGVINFRIHGLIPGYED